jgi:flavin-dependent dehydrogenase
MPLPGHVDLLVVGAGTGGSALAYTLREADLDILVLERGNYLKQESQNSLQDPGKGRRRKRLPEIRVEGATTNHGGDRRTRDASGYR